MRFVLDGCDISFVAEAPSDITLEQLLKQCDKIKPDWCRVESAQSVPMEFMMRTVKQKSSLDMIALQKHTTMWPVQLENDWGVVC